MASAACRDATKTKQKVSSEAFDWYHQSFLPLGSNNSAAFEVRKPEVNRKINTYKLNQQISGQRSAR